MDNKRAGIILIIIAIVLIAAITVFKIQVDNSVNSLMDLTGGVCITESGECIHEQSNLPMYLGIIGIVALLSIAIY